MQPEIAEVALDVPDAQLGVLFKFNAHRSHAVVTQQTETRRHKPPTRPRIKYSQSLAASCTNPNSAVGNLLSQAWGCNTDKAL